jgi:hypothetical protein
MELKIRRRACEAGTVDLSRAPEITSGLSGVHVARSLVF